VEVLRDLGFANAIGLDLNPGPENRFVKKGDFMKLEEADNSIDLIYSNCVDHAFDLDAFFAEHARVLKPNGYVLYDLGISEQLGGGAFEAVSWGRPEDLVQRLLSLYGELVRSEREAQWLWVLLRGKRSRSA
jgi:ubiquinone/menaquinone biosynthesis C-methylase UbiE